MALPLLFAAAFVDGVGRQLVRKYLPAGVDKAALDQVVLKRQELDIRRAEIAATEKRYLDGQKLDREKRIEDIQKLHLNREIRLGEIDYQDELKNWPLIARPATMLKASGARNGRALNVILAVIDHRDAEFYRQGTPLSRQLKGVLRMFQEKPFQALRVAESDFHGDVILYQEVLHGSRFMGASLRSTLWSLLQTEATVLIEMNISTPSHLEFQLTHWGGAFEKDAHTLAPESIQLPTLADFSKLTEESLPRAIAQAEAVLAIGLSSIVVSLGDTHRSLHRPHEIHSPVLPTFVKRIAQSVPIETLKPMLAAYIAAYNGVAAHSPLLASELAARAASTAHSAGQAEMAQTLLEQSLRLNPALAGHIEMDGEHLAMLRRQRGEQGLPLELEIALNIMRGIDLDVPIPAPESADGRALRRVRYDGWK